MDGHFHSGLPDALHTALLVLIILAIWRLTALLLLSSSSGPLQKVGKALAWIIN